MHSRALLLSGASGALTAFKADHPFFIVLRHRPTGTPLFLGRAATV